MKEIAATATQAMPHGATVHGADAGECAVDLDLEAARLLVAVRSFVDAANDPTAMGQRVDALVTGMRASDLLAAATTTLVADPIASRQAEKESLGLEGLLDLKARRTTGDLKTMIFARTVDMAPRSPTLAAENKVASLRTASAPRQQG